MVDRFDVLVVTEDPTRRVGPRAAESLLRWMATTRIVVPDAEAVAETWVEVYGKPGPGAHEPFLRGGYTHEEPVFHELAIRFGTKPVVLSWGVDDPVTFYLEFRGCRFTDFLGPFRKKFKDLLYVRPRVETRPHEELPEHAVVPEDELPVERKKRELGPGMAGTRTEEW